MAVPNFFDPSSFFPAGALPKTPGAPQDPSLVAAKAPTTNATPEREAGPMSDGGSTQAGFSPGGAGTTVAAPVAPPPPLPTTPERAATPSLGPLVADPATGAASHDPTIPDVNMPVTEPSPWEPQTPPVAPPPVSAPPPVVPPTPVTPGAVTPAGTDIFRDALIKQMGQNEIPSVNDAAIKAQLDPFAAAQTRAMRDEIRSGAEGAFADDQDFGVPERVAAAERAGQNTGLKAADLVGRELTARRQQISDALGKYGDQLSAEQQRQLTAKLAEIDATLKSRGLDITESQGNRGLDLNEKELELKKYLGDKDIGIQLSDQDIRKLALTQTGQLGNRELDIRDKLGTMGLNSDMIRTLLADAQFRLQFGLDVGKTQAGLNEDAGRSALIAGMNG